MTFTQGLIGNNQVAHNPSRSLFKASLSQACSTVGKVSELSSNQKTLRLPTVDLRVANGMKCRHKNGNTDATRNIEDSCVDIMSLILIVACCDVHSILQMLLLMGEHL